MQAVLENRMLAHSELNLVLKGKYKLLEQLLHRSISKEKMLSQQVALLVAEKEAQKIKFDETLVNLKREKNSLENKMLSLKARMYFR